MNTKRLVYILIGVLLISFGIGIFSLRYNDDFTLNNISSSSGFINMRNNSSVKIGSNGIQVSDGDEHVSIDWSGIKVNDGDEKVSIGWDGIKVDDGKENVSIGLDGVKVDDGKDKVSIGLDGVKVNEQKRSIFNIGSWNLFGFNRNLKWIEFDEEKFVEIDSQKNINITSPFVDIKVISEDRDDIKITCYGKMKANIVPELKINKKSNEIEVKLEAEKTNSYTITESDALLKIFVPTSYGEGIKVIGSSSDIYVEDITLKEIKLDSSSGDIYINNTKGENLVLSSSSGDIEASSLNGDNLILSSSSGDIDMVNSIGSVDLVSKSGDIEVSGLDGDNLTLSSSSGYIDIVNSIGNIDLESSSGDIRLNNKNNDKNIKIKTSSGNAYINFSKDASYTINGKTSSGDFRPSFQMNIEENEDGRFKGTLGKGINSIDITTSSGDVKFSID